MTKYFKLLLLLPVAFLLMASSNFFVRDNAGILNSSTVKMVSQKNAKYQKSDKHPIVIVETFKNAKRTQPDGLSKASRTVYIVVNQKDNAKTLSIYTSSDLHTQFTAQVRNNILNYVKNDVNSDDPTVFNHGVQEAFRISVTLIDQYLSLPKDSIDLSNSHIKQVTNPSDMRIPVTICLLIIVIGLAAFLRFEYVKNKNKNHLH